MSITVWRTGRKGRLILSRSGWRWLTTRAVRSERITPWAANYVSEGIATPKRNVAERNLLYDISKLLTCPGERPYERAYMEMYDNWTTWSGKGFDEPGFVDEKNGNWNLKPDAAIFKYIPGFEAIPVDKIGCYVAQIERWSSEGT